MPGHIIDCTPELPAWREALRYAGIPWHLNALPSGPVLRTDAGNWEEALACGITCETTGGARALLLCGLENACMGPGSDWFDLLRMRTGIAEIWVWPSAGPCATAVCVEALCHGADGVFASLMETGGGGRIEEVAAAMTVLCGWTLDIRAIRKAAVAAARVLSLQVEARQPVLGDQLFEVESGIHVDGILKDPATYEPCTPELFGLTRHFVRGKHSGRSAGRVPREEA